MKNKFFGGIAALAVATTVAFNVQMNVSEKNHLPDLSLANVEALALGEITESDCDGWCRYSDSWDCVLVTNYGNTKTCYYAYPK
ncbi:MAG: NVEALA domain-containing protein [Dysgonamonadaceae bacterium]|jgi:hypothetical protein|nr:NVEALA domain-containing protein [Dysgonamonadaceae bacterium]